MNYSELEVIVFVLFVLVNIVCAIIIYPEIKKAFEGFRKYIR